MRPFARVLLLSVAVFLVWWLVIALLAVSAGTFWNVFKAYLR